MRRRGSSYQTWLVIRPSGVQAELFLELEATVILRLPRSLCRFGLARVSFARRTLGAHHSVHIRPS